MESKNHVIKGKLTKSLQELEKLPSWMDLRGISPPGPQYVAQLVSDWPCSCRTFWICVERVVRFNLEWGWGVRKSNVHGRRVSLLRVPSSSSSPICPKGPSLFLGIFEHFVLRSLSMRLDVGFCTSPCSKRSALAASSCFLALSHSSFSLFSRSVDVSRFSSCDDEKFISDKDMLPSWG